MAQTHHTKISFIERLQQSAVMLTDGSMSTEISTRGANEYPPCVYNIKDPVLVESIHREFLLAGAHIIQTNTEHANRLALERYNLAEKVYEYNRKGVWIARCAALHKGYVAGVIGPAGRFFAPLGTLSPDDVRQAFIDQAIALVDGGADIIFLKSFIDVRELEIAIDAVQFVSPDIPVIASKTFPEDGAVLSTSFPSDVASRLQQKGIAVLGTNGTVGPQRMLDIVKALRVATQEHRIPLLALPDIGIPTLVDGKAWYNGDPEYVARSVKRLAEAGACIIGAEGGASITHIKAIASAVQHVEIGSMHVQVKVQPADSAQRSEADATKFYQQLGKKFLTAVELDIPRGLDLSSILEGAAYLRDNGIDAVNISDGARARLRMSSIAISQIVQSTIGIECFAHLACRDRNMIGLQSELLGASAMGVKNILAVTGDPAQIGDYPYATSVYDVDSVGLIRALGQMNQGRDLVGNPIGNYTQFCIGCACNPAAYDMDREVRRLTEKAEQGADVAFSQPIFDLGTLETFLEKTRHISIHFMLGIIPLRSARHADFLHHEVPGMTVPDWVRRRIHEANERGGVEAASQEGIRLAVEFLHQAQSMIDGVYLMPPFKKYSMAVDIIHQLSVSLN